MPNKHLDKIKNESKQIRSEVKKQTASYIVAALGIVAGLAWNDAIRGLIEYFFKVDKNSLLAKLFYAVLITIVVIIFSIYINRLANKEKAEKEEDT
ncbi:MAG: DUF5654 family protein [Candidatus Magasanikbacteria bacterium]